MFVLVASAAVAGLVFVYFLSDTKGRQGAYILEDQVTHARLLPKPSAHAFSYPTLALLLSLDPLESHKLDLARGWLFGYGGTSWRVTGLRSAAYLLPDVARPVGEGAKRRSIKDKLREVLVQCGHDAGRLGEVWMLTMPSYMGYEGINPLTVHYCYEERRDDGTHDDDDDGGGSRLAWVVLEIHNTFGEKHVHVLETGVSEDEDRPTGYDHQWTFARDFHVSPFNDRLGHYRVSISAPPAPSSPSLKTSPPRPKIRIHLHAVPSTAAPHADSNPPSSSQGVGPLKLTAVLVARRAVPLSPANLLRALARYPLALFLSFARILYHAWILHYVKHLDVFPRPDPKPAMRDWATVDALKTQSAQPATAGDSAEAKRAYGGIGWQDEGVLEAYSRRVAQRFLRRRASEVGITVVLVSGDPSVPREVFAPTSSESSSTASGGHAQGPASGTEELIIHYAAPRFFTTLIMAPSAGHMLLLGRTEDLFRVNSELSFSRVFAAPAEASCTMWTRWNQAVRTSFLPERFLRSVPLEQGARHPLDDDGGALNVPVVCMLHAADMLEKRIFSAAKARFVPGLEPWGRWERAALSIRNE
ncbi:hypothetical protein C8Q76DRAFT_789134 [Earliella scabrosa]|nr:hypothetical protein C8Q76DRAFT_789134 [Earliella scabrosa]